MEITKKSDPVIEKCSENIENDAASDGSENQEKAPTNNSIEESVPAEKKASDDLMDTDEEEEDEVATTAAKKKKIVDDVKPEQAKAAGGAKRKKVFEDDEDSEFEEEGEEAFVESEDEDDDDDMVLEDLVDDEEEDEEIKAPKDKKKRKKGDKSSGEEEKASFFAKRKKSTTKSKSKGNDNSNDDDKPSSTKSSSGSSINSTKESELISHAETNLSWTKGKPVPYSAITEAFAAAEAITSRLAIQEIMTKLFRSALLLKPEEVICLVYLCSNSVAPAYKCVELGIGEAILIKAIGEASGTRPQLIKDKLHSVGDLGTVASMYRGKQKTLNFGAKPKPLSAKEVLTVFREIANTSGAKSQKWKVDKIKGLLVRSKGEEAKYIIRALSGKLRIGLAESTVLVSFAHAFVLTPPADVIAANEKDCEEKEDFYKDYPDNAKTFAQAILQNKNHKIAQESKLESAVNIIKKAYSEYPSFDGLVSNALNTPLYRLHLHCTLTPGIPVTPMLAKPTKSVQEVLKRLEGKRFTCEYKYDGERAQVHMMEGGETKVFSRNLLDTTEKYPEAPLYVKEAISTDEKVTSFVLDTEVVAWNRETNQFVPFQILSTRKKTEESTESAKVTVIVQAFDLMYLNGTSLLNHSLAQRRELLKKHFCAVDGKFQFAVSLDHTEDGDMSQIEGFLDAAVKGQCEGLMIKTLDDNADYEPSRRSLNWLKLKKDYLEGLGDSVDLVPLGAYFGKGKRTGVYGAYLLACYNVDTEDYESVCKIGTGFSDEDLKTLAASLNKHKIDNKSSQYIVSDQLECDVWFDAVQVWEVKAADLSKSSAHKGAIDQTGEAGRGIGLRFPRFERVRDDKKVEEATSSEQILEMYYAQDSVNGFNGGYNNNDDGI
eukprot:CAMPEP_0116016860 /NCGR_PEP_ID=MMETSP0321-20121206/7720_1 /TAXON_ID=163516 /ORGANISM="Leptocylindrus danicus var. danicus, Strain B650" /LENGTH=883 /DNA_ID=CAMNT_0003486975 /DNA_START=75 /DNA_END=2726 /DNA_ORIENTATION=-